MSVEQTTKPKRRFLSPDKKFQIFLETQSPNCAVGEVLRREGIYSTDLARIRQKVKEGALDRIMRSANLTAMWGVQRPHNGR